MAAGSTLAFGGSGSSVRICRLNIAVAVAFPVVVCGVAL